MNYKYAPQSCRQLMWHLINVVQEREIDQTTAPTHSTEVDYSLFIMVAVLMMLERVEMQPGMAPAAFPLPIFAGSASVSWFSCFHAASFRERLGGSIYSRF